MLRRLWRNSARKAVSRIGSIISLKSPNPCILPGDIHVGDGLERRRDNFLLLRIIAASLVIYGHAPAVSSWVTRPDIFLQLGFGVYSGAIAVNIFFLISGFLVAGSYARHDSFIRFLILRILRIVPGYFVNLVILAFVFGLVFTRLAPGEYLAHPQTWTYVWKNLLFSSDMAWQLPGVLEGSKTSTINGSQWTLPAEMRMYVLLGTACALGLLAYRNIGGLLLAIVLLVGIFSPYLLPLHSDWFRLGGYFILGTLIYIYKNEIRLRFEVVLALIVLAALTRHLPVYPYVFALALAALVFFLAYKTRPLHWLEKYGDPSYGIYLYGWPSQQVIVYCFPQANGFVHVTLALILAFSLGYASWHFVEKRALRLKRY